MSNQNKPAELPDSAPVLPGIRAMRELPTISGEELRKEMAERAEAAKQEFEVLARWFL